MRALGMIRRYRWMNQTVVLGVRKYSFGAKNRKSSQMFVVRSGGVSRYSYSASTRRYSCALLVCIFIH